MKRPRSVRRSTYSKCFGKLGILSLNAARLWVALMVVVSCGKDSVKTLESSPKAASGWDRVSAEKEYRFLMARIDLANSGRPYLDIDFHGGSIKIMLRGTIIWDCRMKINMADSLDVKEFECRFRGEDDRLVRPLSGKHLYEAADKVPDSILAVVGEAAKVDPRLLQRDLPERFLLIWDDGLLLDVHTDIQGSPISRIRNTLEEIRQTVSIPISKIAVVIKMEADDALTLFRVADDGMMTMLSSG